MAPNQWFGRALSASAGSIALMDASGAVVVDAMVYGSQQSSSSANGTITSPEIATLEGDQGHGGCIVVVPSPGRGGPVPAAIGEINRSMGRFKDGLDTDSNCTDFQVQAATTMPAASVVGATNIKVASVSDFGAGQTIMIDAGANFETAVIATVGTAGATTLRTAISAGATSIPVAGPIAFAAGQAIAIDVGAGAETAAVVSTTGGRGGAPIAVIVAAPLRFAHAADVPVSGTGLTLNAPLTRTHGVGTAITSGVPTPGAPNQYKRRD
jgi:hypothetical protein